MTRVKIEKPTIEDIPKVKKLVDYYSDKGEMLPRSLSQLYENIRDFYIVRINGDVVACAALHFLWSDLAEVRTVAVHNDFQGKGYGTALVTECMKEAKRFGMEKVFTLTYIPNFFKRFGFELAKKESLPHKIWSECINCPRFPDCGEVAMVADLTNEKITKYK